MPDMTPSDFAHRAFFTIDSISRKPAQKRVGALEFGMGAAPSAMKTVLLLTHELQS
jgi:hypothetical protein